MVKQTKIANAFFLRRKAYYKQMQQSWLKRNTKNSEKKSEKLEKYQDFVR